MSRIGQARIDTFIFIYAIFHVTRMSETVTFGREIVAYARHLAEY